MTNQEVLKKVDHTLLKQTATQEQIMQLCDEAVAYSVASVCIPPSFVSAVKQRYGDKLSVCTVVGFPNGYNTTETKVFETTDAIKNGADEIDMVINVGWAQEERYDLIEQEISAVRQVTKGRVLKVIVETCFLTTQQKIKLCKVVADAKADFIKTSTGFGSGGATRQDVELFKKHIGDDVKIKASGGIKTLSDAQDFLNLGCERLGASSIVAEVKRQQS